MSPARPKRRKEQKIRALVESRTNAFQINANHLRRTFQRKRKKHGQAGSTVEEANAKKAKRELAHAIKRAKESAWRNLCDLVQKDTWGLPYKLVMDKLTRPPPIP